ncbi:MAG: signal recognition particle-docking protein FtsY [Xanthobacteraceae bacterium]|nr:signal recognition particle-docking protein FtsY [Xanthobacteraceae bacterium]QYK44905.1 MAG: signal recognition particle-docking protein FtsY [Xanthobacteraceae bacterium]
MSFWKRLTGGLSRSASRLGEGLARIGFRGADPKTLQEVEDLLIASDIGVETSTKIVSALNDGRLGERYDEADFKALIASEVEKVLAKVEQPLDVTAHKPFVVLAVGVNGSGKTTTLGKLAAKLHAEGKKVTLGAADTFRAAAIEQLKLWAGRTNSSIVAKAQGSDPAGVAFEAMEKAREENADVLLIDTAGRLQNKESLMGELEKIVRVIKKIDASAPHAVLLVLDATVGQNALLQVEAFKQVAGVTGLVVTKLDGTAKGGILVAISTRYELPVHFIGVGESVDDLETFSAKEFSRALVGLDKDA